MGFLLAYSICILADAMRFFVGWKLATLARNFIKYTLQYTLQQDIKNFVTCPQKNRYYFRNNAERLFLH
jgi:hypothetical protein